MAESSSNDGLIGRVRGASVSLMNTNPQLGMWQATGTAIAQAPNLTELRTAEVGDNIEFNAQGHSALTAVQETHGDLALTRTKTAQLGQLELPTSSVLGCQDEVPPRPKRSTTLAGKYEKEPKHPWKQVVVNGLKAFWSFFLTPSGFFMTIYFLNIVVSQNVSSSLHRTDD